MKSLSFMFPEVRQRVLCLLLLNPERRCHVREIARLINTTAGSLHRELSRLAKDEVLLREVSGSQVYYQANTSLPIFAELVSILRKTVGLANVLELALSSLRHKINVAFVYGSIASGKENVNSDIDVLVIGDITFAEVATALHDQQEILGREINPKVYHPSEWNRLEKEKNAFIIELLKKPKIMIIGNVDDI